MPGSVHMGSDHGERRDGASDQSHRSARRLRSRHHARDRPNRIASIRRHGHAAGSRQPTPDHIPGERAPGEASERRASAGSDHAILPEAAPIGQRRSDGTGTRPCHVSRRNEHQITSPANLRRARLPSAVPLSAPIAPLCQRRPQRIASIRRHRHAAGPRPVANLRQATSPGECAPTDALRARPSKHGPFLADPVDAPAGEALDQQRLNPARAATLLPSRRLIPPPPSPFSCPATAPDNAPYSCASPSPPVPGCRSRRSRRP